MRARIIPGWLPIARAWTRCLRVLPEALPLRWIDLVTNQADDPRHLRFRNHQDVNSRNGGTSTRIRASPERPAVVNSTLRSDFSLRRSQPRSNIALVMAAPSAPARFVQRHTQLACEMVIARPGK